MSENRSTVTIGGKTYEGTLTIDHATPTINLPTRAKSVTIKTPIRARVVLEMWRMRAMARKKPKPKKRAAG